MTQGLLHAPGKYKWIDSSGLLNDFGVSSFYMVSEGVKIGLGAVHKLCRLGRGEGGKPKDDLHHT